jgi:ATP-grasp domain
MAARTDREPAAWVLNLDADLELAGGPRYAPTATVRGAMAPHAERLAASLLAPGDVLVTESSPPGVATGRVGRAFCPTSRAVALLVRAGACPAPHPTQAVLREVNGRAFCASLGPTLPRSAFVRDVDAAAALLAVPPGIAKQWRVKRAFGMAGRGQRRVAPGDVSEADRAFLRSAIAAEGGVMIEPDMTIVRELGIHGVASEDGTCRLGRVVAQTCDAHGQWLATAIAADIDVATREALENEARRVADALTGAGYFGPFGIDAYLYRGLDGVIGLQPRSEINARYSMGFVVGFGDP